MSKYISTHFTYDEVIKSLTASELGLDNNIPDNLIDNARAVAWNILEPLRHYFGKPISPSSWYRSKELNSKINGSDTSDHLSGMAVDFKIIGIDNLKVCEYIRDNLRFKQLILEYYNGGNSGWIHASYDVADIKKEVLHTKGSGYIKGLEWV